MASNDMAQILLELELIAATLVPNADTAKLKLRFEEVANNYHIEKKTIDALENDFSEKVEFYLNAIKLEGYSQQTIYGNKIELLSFSKFINKPVVQVNTSDVRKYLSSNPKWANSTIAKKLSTLKSFYKWMVNEEMIIHDPTAKIRTVKQEKRLPKAMSVTELEMVREACITLRERAIIETFYSTGCRISELAGIKNTDVDWQNGSLSVIGKGNKERIVYLNPKAIYHLKKYIDECEYEENDSEYLLSTTRRPHRKMSNVAIRNIVEDVAGRVETSKKVTPHVFRHTFATLAMDNGIELGDLQQLLGHSNPSTTLRYATVSEERKHNAHKRFVQ